MWLIHLVDANTKCISLACGEQYEYIEAESNILHSCMLKLSDIKLSHAHPKGALSSL
jgi:hypothetical protein